MILDRPVDQFPVWIVCIQDNQISHVKLPSSLVFSSAFKKNIVMASFTEDNIKDLRFRLEEAAIKCSERGLYQSAKWYVDKPILRRGLTWAQLLTN